jgi:hypothetical protein
MNRLSKLQKWVLVESFQRSTSKYGLFLIKEIFYHFYKERNNKLEASTSRSLRNLYKKGLIIPLTARTISRKANSFEDMLKGKPDYAQTMAIKYNRAGKSEEEYKKDLQELIKKHGRGEKLLDLAVIEAGETIQALQLTDLGKKTALMLSNNKTDKLNNKD